MTKLGRPPGRKKEKVSLSLDKDVVELLRSSGNMSTWVNSVLRDRLQSSLRQQQSKKQAEQDPFSYE